MDLDKEFIFEMAKLYNISITEGNGKSLVKDKGVVRGITNDDIEEIFCKSTKTFFMEVFSHESIYELNINDEELGAA